MWSSRVSRRASTGPSTSSSATARAASARARRSTWTHTRSASRPRISTATASSTSWRAIAAVFMCCAATVKVASTTLSTHEDGSSNLDEYATSLVAIEDFSGDGLADVAVSIPDEGRIAVWRGTGDGGLLSPSYYTVGNNSALVSRDLDGDGRPDLAALGLDTVTVMLNQARCE